MTKPIQELSREEAARATRLRASLVTEGTETQSWDVNVYSISSSEPLASDVCTVIEEDVFAMVGGYADVMLGRVGLSRIEAWQGTVHDGVITARLAPKGTVDPSETAQR